MKQSQSFRNDYRATTTDACTDVQGFCILEAAIASYSNAHASKLGTLTLLNANPASRPDASTLQYSFGELNSRSSAAARACTSSCIDTFSDDDAEPKEAQGRRKSNPSKLIARAQEGQRCAHVYSLPPAREPPARLVPQLPLACKLLAFHCAAAVAPRQCHDRLHSPRGWHQSSEYCHCEYRIPTAKQRDVTSEQGAGSRLI